MQVPIDRLEICMPIYSNDALIQNIRGLHEKDPFGGSGTDGDGPV